MRMRTTLTSAWGTSLQSPKHNTHVKARMTLEATSILALNQRQARLATIKHLQEISMQASFSGCWRADQGRKNVDDNVNSAFYRDEGCSAANFGLSGSFWGLWRGSSSQHSDSRRRVARHFARQVCCALQTRHGFTEHQLDIEGPAGTSRLTSASINHLPNFTLCSYTNKKHGTCCFPQGEGESSEQSGCRPACATADTKQVPQLGGRVSDPSPEAHCLIGLYHHIPSTEHICFLNRDDRIRQIHLSRGSGAPYAAASST